jgi:hypothetical protein
VSRHMKAVHQQRHATGDVTGGNFANHHHECQRYHPQCAAGVVIVGVSQKTGGRG